MDSKLYIRQTGLRERFFAKVEKTSTCWNWIASKNKNGYGNFRFEGKTYLSHRFSWFLEKKKFPPEHLLHRCDNPSCVNPEHLFEGNHIDNMIDMFQKERNFPLGKGENHSSAKLTNKQVEEMRKKHAQGDITYNQLAREYGVTRQAVRYQITKKRYDYDR